MIAKEHNEDCPFCRNKTKIISNQGKYHICCDNIHCVLFSGGKWFDTEQQATEAFNIAQNTFKQIHSNFERVTR